MTDLLSHNYNCINFTYLLVLTVQTLGIAGFFYWFFVFRKKKGDSKEQVFPTEINMKSDAVAEGSNIAESANDFTLQRVASNLIPVIETTNMYENTLQPNPEYQNPAFQDSEYV